MHLPGSRRFFEPQCATSPRNNDIVVGVDVVSGIGTRREAPLGNRYTVIFDLYFGGRFHNTFCYRDRRRAMCLLSSTRHDIITMRCSPAPACRVKAPRTAPGRSEKQKDETVQHGRLALSH